MSENLSLDAILENYAKIFREIAKDMMVKLNEIQEILKNDD